MDAMNAALPGTPQAQPGRSAPDRAPRTGGNEDREADFAARLQQARQRDAQRPPVAQKPAQPATPRDAGSGHNDAARAEGDEHDDTRASGDARDPV